jgi:hypothetical protein
VVVNPRRFGGRRRMEGRREEEKVSRAKLAVINLIASTDGTLALFVLVVSTAVRST